jgi:DNA-binding PadR family transcriptional regulator
VGAHGKVRFEVKFVETIIVKNARVKYLVLSAIKASNARGQGLDTGWLYGKVGFCTGYRSLATLMTRWSREGLITAHRGRHGYAREVHSYFLTPVGIAWLEENRERLPVVKWTAARGLFAWQVGCSLQGRVFRSIAGRCRAIDAFKARRTRDKARL